MQIAIVSRAGVVLDAYRHYFEAQGIDLIHQDSIADLFQQLLETPISGVVIDIPKVFKVDSLEKTRLQSLESVFPNVRANWHPEAGFRVLYSDSAKSDEDNLADFLENCRQFKPRALRREKRIEKNLNVRFWPVDATEETYQRAYTSNLSNGGLFVCTCDSPPASSFVWVVLQEVDERPFKVLVKWMLPWGKAARIPGFGGSFCELTPSLAEKLEKALKGGG